VAEAIQAAQTSTYGEGGPAMEFLRARVMEVQLDPPTRNELANALATTLSDSASTHPYKVFVCRQLYIIGGEEQIDELAPLLYDSSLAHVARYALEVIPGAEVNDILWEAIAKSDGPTAAGLAASLAARGGAATVMRLSELLTHSHRDVVAAALIGLGRIGGVESELVLRRALSKLPEDLHTEYHEALLACAEKYVESGNDIESARLFEELMQPALPLSVRIAAFGGLINVRGEEASPLIADALASADAPWVKAALAQVRKHGGPQSTALFAQQLAVVTPETQALLLQALAERGDPAALPILSAGVQSPDTLVQYATIDALATLGNETSLPLLLAGLIGQDPDIAQRCATSLRRIPDAGVNAALAQFYAEGEAKLQVALAPILADRQAAESLQALYASAQGSDTRTSAFKAIGAIARAQDLEHVVALYFHTEEEAARQEAMQSVIAACRRIPPSPEQASARATIYTMAPTSLTRAGALEIFRALGDDILLPLVISACGDEDSIVKDAAIAALAGWPTATPLHEVLALAKESETDAHRSVALDGYIRMLRLESDRPAEESVAAFKGALALAAENTDSVRAILAGLSDLESTAALNLAEGFLADPELHAEAAMASEKIRSRFYTFNASVNAAAATMAFDENIDTFWETETPQMAGQWFEIDMSRAATIKGIVLDASRTKDGYPRGYEVHVYAKGGEIGAPVVTGAGTEGVTEITFPVAITGQIVRVTQTGNAEESPWMIHELRIVPE
jgi:HEAT repeat protein